MKRYVLACGVLLLAVLGSSAATFTQPRGGPAGHWEGTIQVPSQPLNVAIDLAPAAEKWEGTIAIPAQGLKAFPLGDISVQGDVVTFAMKGVPGDPRFRGTLSKESTVLSGDFSQGGGTISFSLTRTGDAIIERPPASTPVTKELEGTWEGTLDVDGTPLRLSLTLANGPGGVGTAMLVSVDQGDAKVPVAAVVQTGTNLKLVVPAVVGNYDADLKDGKLTGTWTQGPRSWPLVLTRK